MNRFTHHLNLRVLLVLSLALCSGCVTFFRASERPQGESVSRLQARNFEWQARNAGSVASTLSIALAGSAIALGTAAVFEVDRTHQFGVLPVVLVSNALFDVLLSLGYAVSSLQANEVASEWARAQP